MTKKEAAEKILKLSYSYFERSGMGIGVPDNQKEYYERIQSIIDSIE